MLTHKEFKARALEREDVKAEYDHIEEEFAFLDEFLNAREEAGVTQAEVAVRMGTTQSAIARLESGRGKPSPSLATLRKYARALGCRLEFRLVKEGSQLVTNCHRLKMPAAGNFLPPGKSSRRKAIEKK